MKRVHVPKSAWRRLEEIVLRRLDTGHYYTNIYDRVLGVLSRANLVEVVRLDPWHRKALKMRWDVEPFEHVYATHFPKLMTMYSVTAR